MTSLSNKFDQCEFTSHSSNPEQIIAQCTNSMNEISRNFIWDNQFVMCKYHYCGILSQLVGEEHNTITCSGAVLAWGSTPTSNRIFNPVVNQDLYWENMMALPDGFVEWPLSGLSYYYYKDNRMVFPENVININCTDDFKTCYKFESGRSECLGNVGDQIIIDSTFSFVLGLNIALAVTAIIYFAMAKYFKSLSHYTIMVIYFFPLAAITLLLQGLIILSLGAYILGNLLMIYFFPSLYLLISSSRNAEKKRRIYNRLNQEK